MYSRNFIYVSPEDQERIRTCRILIGGCGLGSVIAECALRLGFENICIIDGDKVELSNLNRQNYTHSDIGQYKVNALYKRLIGINPLAQIVTIPEFITKDNISDYITPDFDIAINTIDFTSDIPFVFDEMCRDVDIPILHPLNLGWGAGVLIITPHSEKLGNINSNYKNFDLHMAEHILIKLREQNNIPDYFPKVLQEYNQLKGQVISPPQLAVGSWIAASMCTTLLFRLALNQKVNTFPEIYFNTL